MPLPRSPRRPSCARKGAIAPSCPLFSPDTSLNLYERDIGATLRSLLKQRSSLIDMYGPTRCWNFSWSLTYSTCSPVHDGQINRSMSWRGKKRCERERERDMHHRSTLNLYDVQSRHPLYRPRVASKKSFLRVYRKDTSRADVSLQLRRVVADQKFMRYLFSKHLDMKWQDRRFIGDSCRSRDTWSCRWFFDHFW